MHKKIVILRLIGGLGNQLFQLQYALNFALTNEYQLRIDDSFLSNSQKSHEVLAVGALIGAFPRMRLGWFELKIKRSIERLFYKIKQPVPSFLNPIFLFENSTMEIKNNKRLVIDGFWQNKLYITNEFLDSIRSQNFNVKNFEFCKRKDENIVCVHIRRGDYLTNKRFLINQQIVLSIDYYKKGFLFFKERNPNCQFEVYTDDEKWASSMFSDQSNVVVMETRYMDPWTILFKMSCYSKYIIANSTLSWWAAVLSLGINKQVILPHTWGINQPSKHLRLDGWIAL